MLPIPGVSLSSFEELLTKNADEQDFFTVPELTFDHVLCNFPKNVNARMISEFYLMGVEKMKLHSSIGKKYKGCGISVVLSSTYMLIVPLYRPYATMHGRNLYPDPLWYIGLQSMSILPKHWPETAGDSKFQSPFDLLDHCSSSKPI
jgi:hypothetical protein